MPNTAIEIIRTISNEKYKELRSYLESPFFNTNKKLLKLIEIRNKKFNKLEECYSYVFQINPLISKCLKIFSVYLINIIGNS